jgi:hypothetical protein
MPRDTPSSAATDVIDPPRAQASTICAGAASACAVFRRRTHAFSVRRSSSVSSSGASFGLGTRQSAG